MWPPLPSGSRRTPKCPANRPATPAGPTDAGPVSTGEITRQRGAADCSGGAIAEHADRAVAVEVAARPCGVCGAARRSGRPLLRQACPNLHDRCGGRERWTRAVGRKAPARFPSPNARRAKNGRPAPSPIGRASPASTPDSRGGPAVAARERGAALGRRPRNRCDACRPPGPAGPGCDSRAGRARRPRAASAGARCDGRRCQGTFGAKSSTSAERSARRKRRRRGDGRRRDPRRVGRPGRFVRRVGDHEPSGRATEAAAARVRAQDRTTRGGRKITASSRPGAGRRTRGPSTPSRRSARSAGRDDPPDGGHEREGPGDARRVAGDENGWRAAPRRPAATRGSAPVRSTARRRRAVGTRARRRHPPSGRIGRPRPRGNRP